jgi:hypothetical protein
VVDLDSGFITRERSMRDGQKRSTNVAWIFVMNPEESTPEWLQRIVDRFSSVEDIFPDMEFMRGDWPAWTQNVARELVKGLYPTAHIKVGRRWEIGEVGALVGQDIAYLDSFAKAMESQQSVDVKWDQLRKVFGDDIEQRAEDFARKMIDEYFPAFTSAVQFSLTLAAEQDYVALKRFFKAFTRALERRPVTVGDVGRTNTRLYWVLLLSWRRVEELGSIPELHRRLCRTVFLGPHLVGDLKRVEKICERVGLSYPEIAARRERAAQPDTSAVAVSGDNRPGASLTSGHGNSGTHKRRSAKAGTHKKRSRGRARD